MMKIKCPNFPGVNFASSTAGEDSEPISFKIARTQEQGPNG